MPDPKLPWNDLRAVLPFTMDRYPSMRGQMGGSNPSDLDLAAGCGSRPRRN